MPVWFEGKFVPQTRLVEGVEDNEKVDCYYYDSIHNGNGDGV